MDAVKYFEEKRRMLNAIGCCITSSCRDCPIGRDNNGKNVRCTELQIEYPEKAVAIVEKWSQEHPIKTMIQDFLEKHPNAPLESEEIPVPKWCPEDLGYTKNEGCIHNCIKCWNRPIKEGEKQND